MVRKGAKGASASASGGKGSKGSAGKQEEKAAASKAQEREIRNSMRKERNKGKHSKQEEDEEMAAYAAQLRPLGLHIREIQGDGNCLFRSLSDQLYGSCFRHQDLRRLVCDYIESHEEEFAPFFDDTMPLKRHVSLLRKLGTYAGNDAIVAFARAQGLNVVVHQLGQPRWVVYGTENPNAVELHIAYHDWEHYSSIRRIADVAGAASIKITQDTVDKIKSSLSKGDQSKKKDDASAPSTVDERVVMSATGCKDLLYVREILQDHNGSVEDAITYLLQLAELGPDTDDKASDPPAGNSHASTPTVNGGSQAPSEQKAACGSSPVPIIVQEEEANEQIASTSTQDQTASDEATPQSNSPTNERSGDSHAKPEQPSQSNSNANSARISKLQIKRLQKAEKKALKNEKKSQKLKERMGVGVAPEPLPMEEAPKVAPIADISGTLGQLTI